jgi:hypothetical protein
MKTITIERSYPNVSALDESLHNNLSEQYIGLSAHGNTVRVHLTDDVSGETVQQVQQWVQAHDSSVLTTEQEAEQVRQQNLAQMRSANDSGLDLSAYDGSTTEVQALASKIAWLELEIQELRGL